MMRRIEMKLILAALSAMLAITVASPDAHADGPKDILIIANNSVGVSKLSIEEVKAIFSKRRVTWNDGKRVLPLHAKKNSDVRKKFLRKVFDMSIQDELSFWQNEKIRNGTERPPDFSNPLKAVFHLTGSVSYIFRSDYKKGVAKVLLVLPE